MHWVTITFAGIRNLLLFPTISRISRRGAFATHSGTWPSTQSYPFSHECLSTRARCQRPLHVFIPQTRDSPYVAYLIEILTWSLLSTSFFQEYVQVKPFLAIASLALKATGKYNEGEFRADSGYLYVSIIYNASICLSLYCLAMFWLSINEDLKPFRSVVNSRII
jgi:hypothetical protein